MFDCKWYFSRVFCCTFFLCLCATNTAPDISAYHCQCCVSSRHDIDNTYLKTDKVKERDSTITEYLYIYIYIYIFISKRKSPKEQ